MILVGHKVITSEGKQGYIDEITEHNEVVVCVLSDKTDAHTPPYNRSIVVRDVFSAEISEKLLTVVENQQPVIDDLTRFGIVRKVEKLAHGIMFCHFDITSEINYPDLTAVWLSDTRRSNAIPEWEDAFWVKGEHATQVLDAFYLQASDDAVIPIPLTHENTPFECVVEVVLPDGNLRRWRASVDGDSNVLDVEVESDDMTYATSIVDLKELGIKKAHLISTYNMEGFDSIK